MRTIRCSGRPGRWGGGEVFQVEYVSACLPRGVSAQAGGGRGGGGAGVCQTPLVDRMTDRCKNIPLRQLRCGR